MVTHVCNPNRGSRRRTQLHSKIRASLGYIDTLSLNFRRLWHVGHEFEASLRYKLSQ